MLVSQRRPVIYYVLAALIVVIPVLIFYITLNTTGPGWDLTTRLLLGRTLVNSVTHHISARVAFAGEFSNNLLYYFEPYREPLSTPIFALLSVFFNKAIFPYMVLIYAFYLFAVYTISKQLRLNNLITLAVMVNSYIVFFFFVPNGGEGLAAALVLLGLAFALRQSPWCGLLFGLAGIAKYPAIIILPLVFLLVDKKSRVYALLLGLAPLLTWGIIDYYLYGVPFFSYVASIEAAGATVSTALVQPYALLEVVGYAALFATIGVVPLLARKYKMKISFDYKTKMLLGLIILTGIGYVPIMLHKDPFTAARYGFLFSMALLLTTAVVLSSTINKFRRSANISVWLTYGTVAVSIVILACALYNSYSLGLNPSTIYYNPSKPNNVYTSAGTTLSNLGFGNCKFVSNGWIPMLYNRYDSYSPFILYESAVITPDVKRILATTPISGLDSVENTIFEPLNGNLTRINYTQYVQRQERYPILVFKYTGVSSSYITNLNSSQLVYNGENISVYEPPNATCYTN